MKMKMNCKECTKAKHRTCEEKSQIIKRLNVIDGQIKGITKMVAEDRFCEEILTQISAVNHSLKSIGNEILKSHLTTCVINDINEGKMEVFDDVIELFDRLNK